MLDSSVNIPTTALQVQRHTAGDTDTDLDGDETVYTKEPQYDQDFEDEHELDAKSELETSNQVVEVRLR